MRLAWITVNYQQERFLEEWRNSIGQQTAQATSDVFIVDNSGSIPAGAVDARVLNPNDNLGYFAGFNFCIDRIDTAAYDAVVLSNPDVSFAPDFVSAMQVALATYPGMVLAPRITLDSGIEQNPNVANPPGRVRKLYYSALFSTYWVHCILGWIARMRSRKRRQGNFDFRARQIYLPHGACFVATPAFFKACRRLDQQVFLWGEEAFLRHQVAAAGGQIWFTPALRVVHHEHSATGSITSRRRFELMRHAYLLYRNLQ
jgi:GT2 family glycosyltransferase